MKRIIITLGVLCSGVMMAQVGHLMQGIGSVNMSMGGAATGEGKALIIDRFIAGATFAK